MPSDSDLTSLSVLVCCGTIIGLIVVIRGGFALLRRMSSALTSSNKTTYPPQAPFQIERRDSRDDSRIESGSSESHDYDDSNDYDNDYGYDDDNDDEADQKPGWNPMEEMLDVLFPPPRERFLGVRCKVITCCLSSHQ